MLSVSVTKRRGDFVLDIAFECASGVVALFGRSGCGKTTTIDLIAGLLAPDAGRIEIDGEVLLDTTKRIHVATEKRRVGYVFQDSRLFPHLSVAGNLDYGLRRARASGAAAITRAQVLELLQLGPLTKRRPHELSGGERKRVAIGRALLSQPRLLLLDEPLASLDAERRDEVLPYLERLRDDLAIPIVFVSHQFDEVLRLATSVVLMEHGRAIAQGSAMQMSRHAGVRTIVGAESIGSVIEGRLREGETRDGLACVEIAAGERGGEPLARGAAPQTLWVSGSTGQARGAVRLQIMARDVILATEPPRSISVRNVLRGAVATVVNDDVGSTLVDVSLGAATITARVTRAAVAELELRAGREVWVLIKAVSLGGHSFAAREVSAA